MTIPSARCAFCGKGGALEHRGVLAFCASCGTLTGAMKSTAERQRKNAEKKLRARKYARLLWPKREP